MSGIKGWQGFGPDAGKFVPVEDGFHHAAHQCGITMFDQTAPEAAEFQKMLVEWYYSGNWTEVRR